MVPKQGLPARVTDVDHLHCHGLSQLCDRCGTNMHLMSRTIFQLWLRSLMELVLIQRRCIGEACGQIKCEGATVNILVEMFYTKDNGPRLPYPAGSTSFPLLRGFEKHKRWVVQSHPPCGETGRPLTHRERHHKAGLSPGVDQNVSGGLRTAKDP